MFYAERDQNGKIVAIRNNPEEDNENVGPVTEEELKDFLTAGGQTKAYESLLRLSDTGITRVLDDLVEVLIKKNTIMLTDLPEEAREKLGARRETRRRMQEGVGFTVDDIL